MSDVPARDREVVAGAIFRGGRLLLAQRTSPPALAGRWELPGGKVEEFETPQAALARELREELAVEVRCGTRIGVDVQLPAGLVLRAYRAELVSGEPVALDHAQLAWVDAEELVSMDLVDNDRAWIPELLEELRALTPRGPS
ncbi:(deoxy)nucleoside triphosphate pyrophosphohydrolase [Rhodococcus erythropolis]|uniref:(deoxy)nucleoside triphosphate pyrophosphohydrolase n=1 Tax=Rhodococcus erythropolis TaxID=1833 RepID=UPI002949AE36|nr:(deoxy)nucleoside triphosphate pyrophosphohydrolase [Rhodococcus erythropolis]MDV6209337.1 (deoxy)nucleoside triphosphate pyrophosphohydrolase [Rhodococcus erythropolis]